MGAVAPINSFIHVDSFSGPKELGHYLLQLDKDDHQHNSYFQWVGTGRLIDAKFWCRVCALLHQPVPPPSFPLLGYWWSPASSCSSNQSWEDTWTLEGTV